MTLNDIATFDGCILIKIDPIVYFLHKYHFIVTLS